MTAMEDGSEGFVLHGPIVYSKDPKTLVSLENAYVVCVDGISMGVFEELPEEYADLPVTDCWDKVIIPGLVDLHLHAPQYQFLGRGFDMELLDWLNAYTFPEEAKYSDPDYAERAYDFFVEALYVGATTRAAIFATADVESTLCLMDMLEETGLITCVGKVNMDRNVPSYYVEDTEDSLELTREWLEVVRETEYERTMPIITPRFTPSCSRTLMEGLGKLAAEYDLPVQSHLSENREEIELVHELEPDASCYAQTYERAGLMGENRPCIMAHCVWSGEEELEILKRNHVFIAHSPDSNINICSGVAPVKRYLDMGLQVGLATDIAGGSSISMLSAMRCAVQVSKLRYTLTEEERPPLTFPEAFYMATLGGGAFFGKVGSFEKGYSFDAVLLDDESLMSLDSSLTPAERVERAMYLADDRHVAGKYVAGRKLF